MSVQQVEVIEPEITEIVTDADFIVPEHDHQWLYAGVCSVCGKIGGPVAGQVSGRIVTFMDPFPAFGSDEYLTW